MKPGIVAVAARAVAVMLMSTIPAAADTAELQERRLLMRQVTQQMQARLQQRLRCINAATNLSELDEYSYQPELIDVSTALPDREIQVYRRHDGQVGIRNELWILPTVGCVNALALPDDSFGKPSG